MYIYYSQQFRILKRFHVELSLLAAVTITLGLIQLMPISIMTAAHAQSATEIGAPGAQKNEYYIFTQELNANEEKLGLPVAVFTLTNIIVHKGDNVTIHFYNTADEVKDRHTFSMQSPYKVDHDLAGGQNVTFSFKADTVGGFTYYCRYDLPSMVGHLEVLP
jgi:plastocyanin